MRACVRGIKVRKCWLRGEEISGAFREDDLTLSPRYPSASLVTGSWFSMN